jgi:hypothetical protein
MRNFQRKARKRLGKRRMESVAIVGADRGTDVVYVVGLKDGWVNTATGETLWQFGQEHLDDGQTEKDMFDDLMYWFSDVEYREEGRHRFAS